MVPTTSTELINAMNAAITFKIVSGGTSDEFWRFISQNPPDVVIDITKVKEMRIVELTDSYLRLGASLTISEMQQELKTVLKNLPGRLNHKPNASKIKYNSISF